MIIRTPLAITVLAVGSFLGATNSAWACSVSSIPFEEAFLDADTVLQGTVRSIQDASIDDASARHLDKVATLAVHEIWKGRATASEELAYTEFSPACGFELQPGQTITLFAQRVSAGLLVAWRHGVGDIGVDSVDTAFLTWYRAQTDMLRQQARAGGVDEGLAFGEHLTRWNDSLGAKVAYQELIDKFDRDTEAYLGLAIAQHGSGEYDHAAKSLQSAIIADASLQQIEPNPETARWASLRDVRIARAKFLLTGILDKYSRDWSDLVANDRCDGIGLSLGDAIFDRSDLTKCSFERARFAETSFMSANLQNVSFERADLQTANFSSANLNGAKFSGARMVSIIWDGADLRGADFSETHKAGPFAAVDISGAKFDDSTNPGPFLAREKNAPTSLDGVSFRGAELSVYAFLTEDGYWPTSELQADISRADFTGAKIDCGDRDELHLKQSLDAMPDFFLPRFLNEQRVATFIRDNWADVTLTERCLLFVGRKLQ